MLAENFINFFEDELIMKRQRAIAKKKKKILTPKIVFDINNIILLEHKLD